MAKSLKIPPADLTRIALHNHGKFPLARVQKIISGEEQVPTGHGGRVMPVWGPVFSEFDWDQDLGKVRVFNLARYIEKNAGEVKRECRSHSTCDWPLPCIAVTLELNHPD